MNKKKIITAALPIAAVLLCVIINTITGGAISAAAVSVLARASIIALPQQVFISKTALTLKPTDAPYTLIAAVYPENAAAQKFVWKSSDVRVATVDENGTVTPKSSGVTKITVTCGQLCAECEVSVYQPIEKITLNQIQMRVREGTEVQLSARIEPDNSTDKALHWYSTDEMVAIVDYDGNILITGEGNADIGVITNDGVSAQCRILAIEAEPSPTPVPDPTARPARGASSATPTPQTTSSPMNIAPSDKAVSYPYSLADMIAVQMRCSPKVYRGSTYADATAAEVRRYIDPQLMYSNEYMKYQFVDLSRPVGADVQTMNMYLSNKGILAGTGEAFIEAGKAYSISELYLVAHACHETGNGTSKLARGVEYKGTVVYNMFGIGAYDSDPINGGAKYAYEHGWTTPEKAVYGGAEFVSKSYINGEYRQNTLYKMLWNPNAPSKHQYATDIGWAVKQAQTMRRLYTAFGAKASFEIPSYKN